MRLQDQLRTVAQGKYIVAVSGGVDSMVLLDILRHRKGLQLVVAHVDHGIRPDSAQDQDLVASYTMSHNITLETKSLFLDVRASEEVARKLRYDFLQRCRIKHKANGIITAHHQDDLIETAIIALLRGTGWRGVAPFTRTDANVIRPLLGVPKHTLIAYARKHHLAWREDTTNRDESYLRNFVRHSMIPLLNQRSDTWQVQLLRRIRKQQRLRSLIEQELDNALRSCQTKGDGRVIMPRYALIMLPQTVGYEVMQRLMQQTYGHTLERRLAEAALLFAKTARPGKVMSFSKSWQLRTTRSELIVEHAVNVVS